MKKLRRALCVWLSALIVFGTIDLSGIQVNAAEKKASDTIVEETIVEDTSDTGGTIETEETSETEETTETEETSETEETTETEETSETEETTETEESVETEETVEPESEMEGEGSKTYEKIYISGTEKTVNGVIDLENNVVTITTTPGLYEIQGLEPGKAYTFNLRSVNDKGWETKFSNTSAYMKIYGGTVETDDSGKANLKTTSQTYYAIVKEGEKYYAELKTHPSPSSGYNMIYTLIEAPRVESITFPFEKLTIYKGIYPTYNAVDDIINAKIEKLGVTLNFADGTSKKVYSIKNLCVTGSYFKSATYDTDSGQWVRGSQMIYNNTYNLDGLQVGTYVLDFYTPYQTSGKEGNFYFPVEVLDPTDIPFIYSEAGTETISKEVKLANYKEEGNYTYLAADLKANTEYYFTTERYFAYTIRDAQGNMVSDNQGTIYYRYTEKGFKVPKDGTYYVIAWDNNFTDKTCAIISKTGTAPTLKAGDTLLVDSEEVTFKGQVRDGDVISYSGEETEIYELVDLKSTKGYQVVTFSSDKSVVRHMQARILDGTLIQTGSQVSLIKQAFGYHYYPESGSHYYILLKKGENIAADYVVYSNKMPKSIQCDISITTYEGMRVYDYNYYLFSIFSTLLSKQGMKVTYTDGTSETIYTTSEIGSAPYTVYDSAGRPFHEGAYPVVGEYTLALEQPYNLKMKCTVKPKDDMPLLYSKDEEGNEIIHTIPMENYAQNGTYTFFKADLEKDKIYKIDALGNDVNERICSVSILDKDNNFVLDATYNAHEVSLDSQIKVKESGTYYFMAHNAQDMGQISLRMKELNLSPVTGMEIADEYAFQDVFYKNMCTNQDYYSIKEVFRPNFKITHEDGTTEYIPYDYRNNRILFYAFYKEDKQTKASEQINELEPGLYYVQFMEIQNAKSIYVPVTIKDASELTEEMNSGDTVSIIGYEAPAGYTPLSINCYKVHLNGGKLYQFAAKNVDITLLNENYDILDSTRGILNYAPAKEMEGYVVFRNYVSAVDATLTETKQIAEAKIVSEQFKSIYYSEFDEVTLDGLAIEITYADGSKQMVYPSNLEEFGMITKGYEGREERTGKDGTVAYRWKSGTYHFEIQIFGYNKTLVAKNFTVKNAPVKNLVPGESVSVTATTKSVSFQVLTNNGVEKISKNADAGFVYKVNLVKGKKYIYDANFEGSFAIYEDTGIQIHPDTEFSGIGKVTKGSFIPNYTGDFYVRISSKQATDFLFAIAEEPTKVEIVNQPFGNKFDPYYVGLSDICPFGLTLKLTFKDGSEEAIEYGDENWNSYVRLVNFFQDGEYVENPKKDGSYQCEVLLNAKDASNQYLSVMTDTFTLKWGIWNKLGNLLDTGKSIENAKAFRDVYYVKLNVVAGNTYIIKKEGTKEPLSLGYIENHERFDFGKDQMITFTAQAGKEYIAYYPEGVGENAVLTLILVKTISNVALNEDSPTSLTFAYGNEAIPYGVKLDISYKGDTAKNTILLQKQGPVYEENRLSYQPGLTITVLEKDGVSPANKDSKGYYPANPAGENYYFKIQVNEPVENTVSDYVLVPFVIKDAESDYTISFDSNAEKLKAYYASASVLGSMENQTIKKDTLTALSTNKFTAKGYTFVGWTTDESMNVLCGTNESAADLKNAYPYSFYLPGEKVINMVADRDSVKLYAIWKEDVYHITYHTSGAKFVEGKAPQITYTVNSKAIDLPVILNEEGSLNTEVIEAENVIGYRFGGWFADDQFKKPITGIAQGSTGDVDIYAKWIPLTYTLVFHGNGGSAKVVDYKQSIEFDVSTKLLTNTYKMTDFAFMGWSVKATALADVNASNYESFIICGDKGEFLLNRENLTICDADGDRIIHLYAVWTNNFVISYDFDGDLVTGDPYYGEDVDERGEILLAEGSHPTTYTYGQVIKFDTKPVRKGYTFGGWYKDPFYKNKITGITATTFANQKIYAKWIPNTYTIAFKANGGTGRQTSIKTTCFDGFAPTENQVEVEIPACNFTKKGYRFVKWSGVIDGEELTFMPGDMVSNLCSLKGKTVTLNAVWELDTYYLYLNTRGGNISLEEFNEITADNRYSCRYQFDAKVSPVALPTPVLAGYEFGGWFTDLTYKKQVKDLKNQAGHLELYAKWNAPYTICFDANGGNGEMADIIGNTGKEISLTNKFTNPGYAFMGWAVTNDPDGENKVVYVDKQKLICPNISAIKELNANKTLTLYAVWEKEFKITFVPGCENASGVNEVNGSIIDSYKYGDTISILPTPTRTGYTFTGWYLDASCKKKITQITGKDFGDKVLYAGWKSKNYYITFDANAPLGEKCTGRTAKQKMEYNVLKKLTKCGFKLNGYTFKGWATTPNGAVKYTNMQEVARMSGFFRTNYILYAVWEKDVYAVSYDLNNGEKLEITNEDALDAYYKEAQNGERYMVRYQVGTKMDSKDIPVPERMGYQFAGWYLDPACKKKFTGLKVTGTGNFTLYAKWQKTK